MSARPNRETAYRVFAAEFDDASLSYAESDEERAPNYVLTPTGARINRLFAVGVLTEIESVNDEQLRARIVDPTGAFVVYAGQYQPDALSFLERAAPPEFVAVTGKARSFQPEDSNRVFTSVRPETLSEVDTATRDRFTVDAAEHTIERMRTMRDALDRDERGDALREALENEGVEAGLAAGIPRAIDHYGTTPEYLDEVQRMALDAARVVAGERDEAGSLDVAPDEGDAADRAAPADTDETDAGVEPTASTADAMDAEPTAETTGEEAVVSDGSERTVESDSSVEVESTAETDEQATAEPETEVEIGDEESVDDSSEATDETAESEASSGEIETTTETDFDPEEFEIDAEERERIEDEYGTDFESAAEVDGPGEADIETPTPDEPGTESTDETDSAGDIEPTTGGTPESETTIGVAETDTAAETDTTDDAESADDASDEESDTDTEPAVDESEDETETDIDPEAAVVAAMRDLDDGDGAEREAVIESVVENGLTREDAEAGIQSALMSGECYEPDDDTLKPI